MWSIKFCTVWLSSFSIPCAKLRLLIGCLTVRDFATLDRFDTIFVRAGKFWRENLRTDFYEISGELSYLKWKIPNNKLCWNTIITFV